MKRINYEDIIVFPFILLANILVGIFFACRHIHKWIVIDLKEINFKKTKKRKRNGFKSIIS